MKVNSISIDFKDAVSNLCVLGMKYPTDKCPNNKERALHKHAYTPYYDMLFSSMRYNNNLLLAEIGIYHNMSMMCWRKYFPHATLYGLEWSNAYIQKAITDDLYFTHYVNVDVTNKSSVEGAFQGINKKFDIIIEDSTHVFEDQIRVIESVYDYMKPGGILIIEDIFLSEKEERYVDELKRVEKYFSSATFVHTNHVFQNSKDWNNDKLLVLFRNDV
jgi:SAM-dependent methyltransferase